MPNPRNLKISDTGFTLAELLISLAILGVIATFTIPKIISAQTNGAFNASAKEDAAAMAAAFQTLRYSGNNSYSQSTFLLSDLTPYINYMSVDTTSLVDNVTGFSGSTACSGGTAVCLKIANGSTLFWFTASQNFSGTQAIFFVDPDGVALNTASTTGPSKSMGFYLSTTGSLQTSAGNTPSWFSW